MGWLAVANFYGARGLAFPGVLPRPNSLAFSNRGRAAPKNKIEFLKLFLR